MRIAKNGDVNVAGDVDVAGNMDVGTINGGATTVSSLSTAAVGSHGYGPISVGTITSSSKNNIIPGLHFGTTSSTGLILQETISVGTSWVNVPHTAKRGAYLILASGTHNDDSAGVWAVSDDSNYVNGHINTLTLQGDYSTNFYLSLQYPINSYVQIKMNSGGLPCNTRNVSIVVIRAGG
jgi:hypothetical protein